MCRREMYKILFNFACFVFVHFFKILNKAKFYIFSGEMQVNLFNLGLSDSILTLFLSFFRIKMDR